MLLDIITSLVVVFLPVIVIAALYVITIPSKYSLFFKRFFLAFIAFWIFYQFSPALIFYMIGTPVNYLFYGGNTFTSWSYIFNLVFLQAFLSMIYIAWYPIFLFAFAFFVAPFISLLILAIAVRPKNMVSLSFWIDLKERLKSESSDTERELLKLLIALLPVSLYFLTTLLRIFGVIPSFENLGWILEVYLVYLLTFLTSVQILYTARVYYKDKFIGDSIRQKTFNNLLSISIVLSIISLVAFIQTYPEAIYLFVYFSLYYVMATTIFLSFYRYIELSSVYLLAKILLLVKDKKLFFQRMSIKGALISAIIGVFASFVSLSFNSLLSSFFWRSLSSLFSYYISVILLPSANPKLFEVVTAVQFLLIANLQQFFDYLLVAAIVFYLAVTKLNSKPIWPAIIAGISKIITDKVIYTGIYGQGSQIEIWVASVFCVLNMGDTNYYLIRIATIIIDPTKIPYATYLLEPFSVLRIISSVVILLTLFYVLLGNVIQITLVEEGKRTRFLCTPSKISTSDVLVEDETKLLIIRDEKILDTINDENAKKILTALKERPKNLTQLKDIIQDDKTLRETVNFLLMRGAINYLDCELKLSLPATFVDGIYVVNKNGLSVFSQTFGRIKVDPVLVSGMLSAITSFVKETTKSTQYLKSIDHGDVVLMIEYNPKFFVAMLTNRETPDLRMKLKRFVEEFDKKYGDKIREGVVVLEQFQDADKLVREIFSEEIPIAEPEAE
ncbi:MAG: hypothetical protein ACP6IS_06550 [Candidatus Asgardarchaeia archaeon]